MAGYSDALGGTHEIPQYTYRDVYGQQHMTSGYNGTEDGATIHTGGGKYRVNNSNGTWTRVDGGGASGLASIIGGSGGWGSGGVTLSSPTEKAAGAYRDAIANAQSGVDSAKNLSLRTQGRITNATADLDEARKAARGIGTQITNLTNSATSLSPLAQTMTLQGNDLLSVYRQLMNGDSAAGGTVGNYLSATESAAAALAKINADDYVASAVSDAQASAQNAQEQAARELTRRGVSVGSGAYGAAMKDQSQALATLRAAAATQARREGLSAEASAQAQRASLYKGVLDAANTQSEQGLSALNTAAGVISKQADIFGTAGSLGATQSNAFANIAGVEVNLGDLDIKSEGVLQDAIGGVTSAQQALAKFYQDTLPTTKSHDDKGWGDYDETVTYG